MEKMGANTIGLEAVKNESVDLVISQYFSLFICSNSLMVLLIFTTIV